MDTSSDYINNRIVEIDKLIVENESLLSDPEFKLMAEEDIKKLQEEKNALLNANLPSVGKIDIEKETTDPYAGRNILLEVRGAAGGEEAKSWADDLIRMYTRYALNQGWKTEILDDGLLKIKGKNVYGKLKYEAGVHRVQRVPTTESSGRIHTSTATIAIIPELADIDIPIKEDDLTWDFYRSGGKGGQNVNKVSTAVRLTHKPTNIIVTCQTERYQNQNREIALQMLRAKLWETEEEKQMSQLSADRLAQIGTGMRNEKIRTYNFLQDRITDHRLNKNLHHIEEIMNGKLDDLINDLQNKFNGTYKS